MAHRSPPLDLRHEELLHRLADALARVAQEQGEDVDSEALLSPPTEEVDDAETWEPPPIQ